jgi:hypothetical protein
MSNSPGLASARRSPPNHTRQCEGGRLGVDWPPSQFQVTERPRKDRVRWSSQAPSRSPRRGHKGLERRSRPKADRDQNSCRAIWNGLPTTRGRRGRASAYGRAGAERGRLATVLAARATTVPFIAVMTGFERTTPSPLDLRDCLPSQVATLPDLALQAGSRLVTGQSLVTKQLHPSLHSGAGPRWVRTAAGTVGPRRARAVNVGEQASRVTGGPPLRPWTPKQPGAGFESLSLRRYLTWP